jgi:hypothetical protein
MRLLVNIVLVLVPSLMACSGGSKSASDAGDSTGSTNPPTAPVPGSADLEYTLEESTAEATLFTAPPTRKPTTSDAAPVARGPGLHLFAARNEFEPALLEVAAGHAVTGATMGTFPTLGAGQRVSLQQVGFVEGWGETLGPVGAELPKGLVALWLTVFVPKDAPKGEHQASLTLTMASGKQVVVPVALTVFDFALPDQIHFASQMNVSVGALVSPGGTAKDAHTLLYEHRFTPDSSTWPSGFAPAITWDSAQNPSRCSAFWDEPSEGAEYAIGTLSRRYILGEGWNGAGYPNAEVLHFVDNSTPRPATFCGVSRGSDQGSDPYNAAWGKYLSALDAYLVGHGMADKAYHYVQNEPQNEADYALAAHLCRLSRAAAPHLRLAISEEPKPEIAERSDGACGFDIWIAHVRAYQQDYAWKRQREHGESVWIYSLDHDPDPYFNPTRVDRSGLHARIIPWVGWRIRASGFAYYDVDRFFPSGRPGVRAELLREGFEDYEYLWLANGKKAPAPGANEAVDPAVASVASGLSSFTKDPSALTKLRIELGRYIEGSRTTIPVVEAPTNTRPRVAAYLNFQDPKGKPTADPLVVAGHTYQKIGWDAYDPSKGYGWSGENIKNPGIALYGYDEAGATEIERSYLYDDYGRDNLFEFALAPGRYRVTVGAGRPARAYPNDPHTVIVEGTRLIDDEPTTDAARTFRRSAEIDISDGSLSLVAGGRSAKTGDYAYTFLQFLDIEPID